MVYMQRFVLLVVVLLVDWSACQDISNSQRTVRSKRAMALLASIFNGTPIEHLLPGLTSGGTQKPPTGFPETRLPDSPVGSLPTTSLPAAPAPIAASIGGTAEFRDVGLIATRPVRPGPAASTSAAPVSSASPPVLSASAAPVSSASPPVSSASAAPVSPASATPVSSASAPVSMASAAPVSSASAPVSSASAAPVSSASAPVSSASAPVSSASAPVSSASATVSSGTIPSTNPSTITQSTAAPSPPNRVGCSGNFTSSVTPTSVHQLKVGDIKVVAAMGDSVTAANGAQATNVFGVLTEYRGRAFSIGGDLSYIGGVTTLPNILKEFNAQVHGFSTGFGTETSPGANLNVAIAGAQARHMASQAASLVAKLRADPRINVDNDWKVVTLFVGGNDLCQSCEEPAAHTARKYRAGVERALNILRAGLPRTLVNVVQVFDIDVVINLARSNFLCRLVIGNVCPCGMSSDANRPALRTLSQKYRTALEELVASGKYDSRADFTVVIQPFFSRLTIPQTSSNRIDFSYFAPDCFHLSDKGQQAAGRSLWNNMVQNTANKQTDLLPLNPLSCPTTDFIPTRLN